MIYYSTIKCHSEQDRFPSETPGFFFYVKLGIQHHWLSPSHLNLKLNFHKATLGQYVLLLLLLLEILHLAFIREH